MAFIIDGRHRDGIEKEEGNREDLGVLVLKVVSEDSEAVDDRDEKD